MKAAIGAIVIIAIGLVISFLITWLILALLLWALGTFGIIIKFSMLQVFAVWIIIGIIQAIFKRN